MAITTTPIAAPKDLAQLEIRDGALIIAGTHKDDRITITRESGDSKRAIPIAQFVSLRYERVDTDGDANGIRLVSSVPTDATRDRFIITTGKNSYFADVFGLTQIRLNGGDGNDTLQIGKNLLVPADVRGRAGNDTLEAGSRKDILRGGAGDDTMINVVGISAIGHYQGGDGNDTLLTTQRVGRFLVQQDQIGDVFESYRFVDAG